MDAKNSDALFQEVVNKKRPIKNFKIAIRRNRCLHLQIHTVRIENKVMITIRNKQKCLVIKKDRYVHAYFQSITAKVASLFARSCGKYLMSFPSWYLFRVLKKPLDKLVL